MTLFVTLVLGCDASKKDYFGTTKPKHPPNEIWINNGGEPEWIDPGRCSDTNGGEVIDNLFAGLVELHPRTLEPMPDVAKSWEVSEGGTVYTFHLRESKWSDGKPLTARDFEWSFKRVLDPKLASKYVSNMFIFKNAQARTRGALYVSNLPAGINAENVESAVFKVVKKQNTINGQSDQKEGSNEPAEVRLDSVEWTDWPQQGAMIFLKGNSSDLPQKRHEIIAELASQFGGEIQASVADESVVGIRALDDHTLELRLRDPIPYALSFLSYYTFKPVPRHLLERLDRAGIDRNYWTRPEHLVCNGAYIMSEWRFRQYMMFEANPNYWNASDPNLQRIERVKAFSIESYNTSLNLYYAGEIDYPGGNTSLPAEFLEYLRQFKDYRHDPYLGIYFYWFNTKRPPVDNLDVRKALALAINREELVTFVTRGGQLPLSSIIPDGLAGYDGLDLPTFDLEAAKAHLAKAGYPNGKGFPDLTVMYNTSEGHKQIAESVQQMWKSNLNINVKIENQEWKVYLKTMNQREFQMARLGWIGDYADPYTFLELLTSDCANNRSNWSDPEYDRLIKKANSTQDSAGRLAILRQAEEIAIASQPLLPIYVYTRSIVVKPYVRGIWGNYQDRHQWKYLWIDEQWYNGVPDQPAPDPAPPLIPIVATH